jgi:glutamyl-Q tRNA(Asp) synthetase
MVHTHSPDAAEVVTRFAPSPTGYLHLGHAFSALLNVAQARAFGGRFLLRIEDIDRSRCRPEYEAALLEDLTWLGIRWDGEPLRQSDRLAHYEAHLDDLRRRGLVYRCFKSRADIAAAMRAPHASDPDVGDGAFVGGPLPAAEEEANLAAGRAFAWRLSMDRAAAALGPAFDALTVVEECGGEREARPARPGRFGDVVLGRKDSGTSYHLASVLDDAAQGVTHVTRGEDLREAASLHVLLYALFGLSPPVYRHHALITDDTGRRLAKRDRATTLRAMREAGMTAEDVRESLRERMG